MMQPIQSNAYCGRSRHATVDTSGVKVMFSDCGHFESDITSHAIWASMLETGLLATEDVSQSISTGLPCPRCHYLGPSTVSEVVRTWTSEIYDGEDWRSHSADNVEIVRNRARMRVEIGWILSIVADQRTAVKIEVFSLMLRQLAFVCVRLTRGEREFPGLLHITDSILEGRDAWRFYRALAQEKDLKRKDETKIALHDYYDKLLDPLLDSLLKAVHLLQCYLYPEKGSEDATDSEIVLVALSHLAAVVPFFGDLATQASTKAVDSTKLQSDLAAVRNRVAEDVGALTASYQELRHEVDQSLLRESTRSRVLDTSLTVFQGRAVRLRADIRSMQEGIKALHKAETRIRVGILNDKREVQYANTGNEDGEESISSSSSVYSRE